MSQTPTNTGKKKAKDESGMSNNEGKVKKQAEIDAELLEQSKRAAEKKLQPFTIEEGKKNITAGNLKKRLEAERATNKSIGKGNVDKNRRKET